MRSAARHGGVLPVACSRVSSVARITCGTACIGTRSAKKWNRRGSGATAEQPATPVTAADSRERPAERRSGGVPPQGSGTGSGNLTHKVPARVVDGIKRCHHGLIAVLSTWTVGTPRPSTSAHDSRFLELFVVGVSTDAKDLIVVTAHRDSGARSSGERRPERSGSGGRTVTGSLCAQAWKASCS
jgi:hypothetical protein